MCPHIRALTWLLLIYYATWISLSEFHMISQDQATYFLIIFHLHILYSRFNTYFSLHMPLPVWIQASTCVYPFHFLCLCLPISHNVHILLQLSSVSVMHACVYPFIHSGVVVSLELSRPLSSRLAPWLRRFLILHIQDRYCILWTHIQAYPSVVYHCRSRVMHVSSILFPLCHLTYLPKHTYPFTITRNECCT